MKIVLSVLIALSPLTPFMSQCACHHGGMTAATGGMCHYEMKERAPCCGETSKAECCAFKESKDLLLNLNTGPPIFTPEKNSICTVFPVLRFNKYPDKYRSYETYRPPGNRVPVHLKNSSFLM